MKNPKTITFRMDAKKVKQLDSYAEQDERDRSYLLNEAVDHYLEVRQFQIERIKEGVRQAAAGDVVEHAQVVRRLRKRHSAR